MRLPDWLILGAPKAGTTTLADWLRDHPDAFVSAEKETWFFGSPRYEKGLDWYASHFEAADPDQRAGEATPSYLYFDHALDRIARVLPNVRLAVILREPAVRVWSHIWYFRTLGLEHRDPVAIVEAELANPDTSIEGLGFGYLHMSRYVDRLEAVTRRFDRGALVVLLTEELRADPDGEFGRLCEHFGLRPIPAPRKRANVGGAPRSVMLQRAILQVGAALPGSERKRRILRRLAQANLRGGYPEMPQDLEDRVRAAVAEDNDLLANWLGRDLPETWSSCRR
jgi:hypothetical protein